MVTPPRLRAMSIPDLLDAAFRLYRSRFLVFVGIAALPLVPLAMLLFVVEVFVGGPAMVSWVDAVTQAPLRLRPGDSLVDIIPVGAFASYFGLLMVVGSLQSLGYQLVQAALAYATDRIYRSEPVGVLAAYQFGWRRLAALIVATLCVGLVGLLLVLVVVGCPLLIVLTMALRPGDGSTLALLFAAAIGMLVGGLLLIPVSLFIGVRLLLYPQAIVQEGCGPFAALGRSWRLAGTRFWRMLGVYVLGSLLSSVITLVPSLILSALASIGTLGSIDQFGANQGISSLIQQFALLLTAPYLYLLYTLLYYDLRIRREGYDLEMQLQQR